MLQCGWFKKAWKKTKKFCKKHKKAIIIGAVVVAASSSAAAGGAAATAGSAEGGGAKGYSKSVRSGQKYGERDDPFPQTTGTLE